MPPLHRGLCEVETEQSNRARLVETVRHLKDGAQILSDWLGEGAYPVPSEQAESRAAVCRLCPLNEPSSFSSWVKRGVAQVIRAHLFWKNRLSLPTDKTIGMCAACGCVLNLKVWVPLKHILDTLPQEDLDRLHPGCWVRKEMAA